MYTYPVIENDGTTRMSSSPSSPPSADSSCSGSQTRSTSEFHRAKTVTRTAGPNNATNSSNDDTARAHTGKAYDADIDTIIANASARSTIGCRGSSSDHSQLTTSVSPIKAPNTLLLSSASASTNTGLIPLSASNQNQNENENQNQQSNNLSHDHATMDNYTGGGYYPHERSTFEPSFNAYAIDGSLVSDRLMCQHQHAAAATHVRSHENDLVEQRMGVLDQSSSLSYSDNKLSHQNSRWSFILTIYVLLRTLELESSSSSSNMNLQTYDQLLTPEQIPQTKQSYLCHQAQAIVHESLFPYRDHISNRDSFGNATTPTGTTRTGTRIGQPFYERCTTTMHGGTHIHTGQQSLLHEERQKHQHLPYSPLSDVIEGKLREVDGMIPFLEDAQRFVRDYWKCKQGRGRGQKRGRGRHNDMHGVVDDKV